MKEVWKGQKKITKADNKITKSKRSLFIPFCVVVIILTLLIMTGCYNADYISEVSMDADTRLGNLEECSVLVILPMGTFDEETKVTLTRVKKGNYSKPDESRFELAMSPTDISLEEADYIRTGRPVSITFKLDEEFLSEIEDESFVQVADYFDGEWYLQPAKSVDLNNGIVEAEIYHFS